MGMIKMNSMNKADLALKWKRCLSGNDSFLRRIIEYLEYLYVFVIIVQCNSMYTNVKLTDSKISMTNAFYAIAIPLAFTLLALHLLSLDRKKLRELRRYLPVWIFLAVYVGAFYFLNVRFTKSSYRQNYFRNFVFTLLPATLLFKVKQLKDEGPDLFFKYSDVVCAIAAASLLIYLTSMFHVDTMPSDVIYTRWSETNRIHERVNLFNICMFWTVSHWQTGSLALLRNFGFFVEPLMFSIPLLTALCTELFLRTNADRRHLYKSVLLSAALLTASATLALMLMAFVWGMKCISLGLKSGHRHVVIVTLCAIAGICIFLYIKKKGLSNDNTQISGSSIYDHIEDYRAGLKAFMHKPLLGGGYNNHDYIREFMDPGKLVRNAGLSNSAGIVLGEGGLMLGILCMMPLFICLLYYRNESCSGLAYWGMGILGIYGGIIFLFHLYLVFWMAFGYSLLEIRPADGKSRMRLGLADLHMPSASVTDAPGELRSRRRRVCVIAVACVVAGVLVAVFGLPLLQVIHRFIRTHQFSISQAPLKAFWFNVALLLHPICISEALRGKLKWKRLAFLLLWDAAYLVFYPRLYSDVITMLSGRGISGQADECVWMAGVYFAGAMLALNLALWKGRQPNYVGIGLLGTACIAAIAMGCSIRSQINALTPDEQLLSALENLAEAADGRVYVNEKPAMFKQYIPKISLSTTVNSGFELYDSASFVCDKSLNRPELIENGFQVAELSKGYIIYSNDESVLTSLGKQGIAFSRYYSFQKKYTLKTLARSNALEQTAKGYPIIAGEGSGVLQGPSDTLYKGQYTANYSLHISRKKYKKKPGDTVICTLLVSCYNGEQIVGQKDVTLDQFNTKGVAIVGVPFKLDTITDDVDCQIIGHDDSIVELRKLAIRQTPDYITVTSYNCHRDPLREAYYYNDGRPFVQAAGYCAQEKAYNLGSMVTSIRYFGPDGLSTMTSGGYAEIRYGYNSKRMCDYEAYYGLDGQPVLNTANFAAVRTVYDNYGNPVRFQYFGTDGALTINSSGYAELRREYNDKKQLIRETYYDDEGVPRKQTSGYTGMEQEFDEAGNVSVRRFTDEGVPVLRTEGYAEVHWQYNDLKQIVREDFIGLDGKPVMVVNGYAAAEYEYDEAGNTTAYHYFNTEGLRTVTNSGYASVRRVFNEKRQVIREAYFGVDEKPMMLNGGYAGWEREYNENSEIKQIRYFGLEGEPILIADGYHELRREYDSAGNMIEESYYDTEERPVMCQKGYAVLRRTYDDTGAVTEEAFYDTEGNPCGP